MVTKQKILIVDDDNNIAELISLYLTKECFETRIVNDGEQALKEFNTFHPDLILLDLMLPGIDGYQVCREIRHNSDVPIIMLSAKGETFDKVLGLELGADDYIIKPFDTKELVARVRAVLRRFKVRQPAGNPDEKCVSFPDLTINLTNYSVTYMGRQVDMQFITDAPDGGKAPLRMIFDFFTQTFDVYIYGSGIANIFISPDMVKKLFSCKDLIR